MNHRHVQLAVLLAVAVLAGGCGDSGSGGGDDGDGSGIPDGQSPSSVTAEDLYGHWSLDPAALDGDYSYLSFMRRDPEYALDDTFLLTHAGSTDITRGTFEVDGGSVHLTSLTSSIAVEHTIDGFNGELLGLSGESTGTDVVYTRRERCHAPGDWHSVGAGYRYGSFDVHGDLHMTGPAGTLSTRVDLCGAWPLVDIPAGHDVYADDAGAVWIVQLNVEEGLLVYGFDPLAPETSVRKHVVATENVGAPGIHTELYLAMRAGAGGDPANPDGLLVVGTEGRAIWEHVDGSWQMIRASDDMSLADLDTEVFFDGEGRLHVSSGAQVIAETAPQSGTFEVWAVEAAGAPMAGSVNQGVRYAFDAQGRLHSIFTELLPASKPDNPSLVADGGYVMVHGLRQDDGTWTTTPLTGGLALDLAFGDDGRLHIGLLENFGDAAVGQLVADMGSDGIPTSWRTRLAPASHDTVGVHAAQYNRAFPIGRFGPAGSYFVSWQNSVHASPDFQAWHFGQDGAPVWPVDVTIEEDSAAPGGQASIAIPELGVTCEGDCTVELERGRVYRYELGGDDLQTLGAGQWRWDWGWLRGWMDNFAGSPAAQFAIPLRVKRAYVLSAAPFLSLDEPLMQTSADLDVRSDGRHLVTWHALSGCGNGSSTTDVTFTVRNPDTDEMTSGCVSGHAVLDAGLQVDDTVVALAVATKAMAPGYGGSDALGPAPSGPAFVRVDGETLDVTDGHFLAGYEDMANLAVSGTEVAAFGRHVGTGEGHLIRWDTAAPQTLLTPVVVPATPFDHIDTDDGWVGAHDGTWYALGYDALVAVDAASGTESWSTAIPRGRQLAVGPDGTLHVFADHVVHEASPDLGGGPLEGNSTGFIHARFTADGLHLSSRFATGGLADAIVPLPDGGVMLADSSKFSVMTWVLDPDADRWSRSWSVEIGGLVQIANTLPHTGRAALAVGMDDRVWAVNAQTTKAWVDYDKSRVHSEEFTQLIALELAP